jgi:hypothetical protein
MADAGMLADKIRLLHREQYRMAELDGSKRPFLVPLAFVGYYMIPTLYLAIPHKNRPWLYRARWVVLAFTTYLNLELILGTSSVNVITSYAAGLIGAWAIIWNFTLLVWTRPQWDAKRIRKVPSKGRRGDDVVHHNSAGHAGTESNGRVKTNGHASEHLRERKPNGNAEVIGDKALESNDHDDQGFIYVWQDFPEKSPLVDRLDWAFGLVGCFRMTGWNWAIKVLPPYRPPAFVSDGSRQLPLSSLPNTSKHGFTRQTSLRDLLTDRILFRILPGYLVFDLCATLATQDPYFVVGSPYHNEYPLPSSLAHLHPLALSLYRSAVGFVGVLAGLSTTYNFAAVLLAVFGPPIIGFRAAPWHLPSMNGSFTSIFEHGLSGFWGTFWHQTLRFGFEAPTRWLIRNKYVKKGSLEASVVGSLVAFALSGFAHASGSHSTISPTTRPWEPPIFFFLAGIGMLLQQSAARAFAPQIEKMPRWIRRLTNLLVTAGWLHLTCGLLLGDFARSGLFLFEPVPFSVARYLGFGAPGDRVLRWDLTKIGRWYVGKHWWEVGLSV